MEMQVQRILDEIKSTSVQTFEKNLVGIYVHGSLALGCFSWDNSDIDFIVVLKNPPTQAQKEEHISELMRINEICPPKGLEMSIVLDEYTSQFIYPTPFELHFSNSHLRQCTENISEYCMQMNGTDKDLTAHFTIINNACITIYGKEAENVFGEVPKKYYWDSILYDIENAEKDIIENPIYTILNLCRVLAYKNDSLILSKKDGGNWAMKHVDTDYIRIIKQALNKYQSSGTFKIGANDNILRRFAKYMRNLIL